MNTVRFVLMRPAISENLGAAARALKNFGFDDWCWVDSRVNDFGGAERLAVHAADLLEKARRVGSLDDAVDDCTLVVGTSSRRVRGKKSISARELAEQWKTERIAIVFGDERSGLTNEEVDRCHLLSTIPTTDAQPSVNLAQSVLLYAYEMRIANAPRTSTAPRARRASAGQLRAVEVALEELLTAGQFLVHRERHALRDLRQTLVRSELSTKEAQLWTAALRRVRKRLA